MFNIPDDCAHHPDAPWNTEDWHCPECRGHHDDVTCEEDDCEQNRDEDSDPVTDGAEAYYSGEQSEVNPYLSTDSRHSEWDAGWVDAYNEENK